MGQMCVSVSFRLTLFCYRPDKSSVTLAYKYNISCLSISIPFTRYIGVIYIGFSFLVNNVEADKIIHERQKVEINSTLSTLAVIHSEKSTWR